MAFDIGSAVAHITADISDFQSKMKEVGAGTEQAGGFFSSLAGKATIVAGTIAAVGAAVGAVGWSFAKEAGKFEQYGIAFETMLGSVEKGNKLMEDLKLFAKQTPFNFETLVDGSKRLLAYGIEGDKVIDIMKNLGNISAGVGMDKLPNLILAFGQVKAATKLTGMELRQFSEAGVPLLDALVTQANAAGGALVKVGGSSKKAKVDVGELNKKLAIASQRLKEAEGNAKTKQSTLMSLKNTVQNYQQKLAEANATGAKASSGFVRQKVTAAEMIKVISDGGVTFDQVQKALGGMTGEGGKFFNLMDKQSKTMLGRLSNLQDAWQQFTVVLGNFLLPVIGPVIDQLTGLLNTVQQLITTGDGMKMMQAKWQEVLTFLAPFIQWFVSVILPELQKIWAEIWYFINQVVPPLVTIFNFLVFQVIMPIVTQLVAFWQANWTNIAMILKGAWEAIYNIIKFFVAIIWGTVVVFLDLITGHWKEAWENIKHYVSAAWNALEGIFNGMISFISGWGGIFFNKLVEPFKHAWDEINKIVDKIKDKMDFTKRNSPSVVDIVTNGVDKVNAALQGLIVDANVFPQAAAMTVQNNGMGTKINNVTVDLAGAYISDSAGAMAMGEKIGDSIIKKLNLHVRY